MSIVSDDFEAGTGHFVAWYGSPTITHSTADAHTGTGSLSIVPGAAFYGVTQSTFNGYGGITAGNQYASSIWVKARVGTIGQHVMQVEWLDNTNTQISSVDTTFTPGASWTQVTSTLTAPAGAVRINLGLLANGTGDVATEWLADDFDISAVGGASLTADVTETSTLNVSTAATQDAVASTIIVQTSAITSTAAVSAVAGEIITSVMTISANAIRIVHADLSLPFTVGTTIDAIRGAVANQSIGSTLTVTPAAIMNAAPNYLSTSTLAIVTAASIQLHTTHSISSTFTVTIDVDVVPSAITTAHGSWWQLHNILQTQAELEMYYRTQEPVACPKCGEPLRQGPPQRETIKYCSWGHFQYPRDWNQSTMSGM